MVTVTEDPHRNDSGSDRMIRPGRYLLGPVSVPLQHDDGGIAGSLSLALPAGPDNTASIEVAAARLAVAAQEITLQARITTPD